MQADPSLANHPSSPVVLWLMVLTGAIIAALAATIIDNRVKGTYRERTHNNLFLINECLAEHQSAYLIFAVGLVTGSVAFKHDWVRDFISIYIFITFTCYIIGVGITAEQEEDLKHYHTCSRITSRCTFRLSVANRFRVIWVNLFLALILFSCAVYLCANTVKAPG